MSIWLIAAIRRTSAREKRWTVFCVILNIAHGVLIHTLDVAHYMPNETCH
jgi:hypothetical protein